MLGPVPAYTFPSQSQHIYLIDYWSERATASAARKPYRQRPLRSGSTLLNIFFLLNSTNQEIASKKHDLLTMVSVMMMVVPGHPEICCCGVALVKLRVADGDPNADEVEDRVVVDVQGVLMHLRGSMRSWPPLSIGSHR